MIDRFISKSERLWSPWGYKQHRIMFTMKKTHHIFAFFSTKLRLRLSKHDNPSNPNSKQNLFPCVFHMLRNSFWHRYFRMLHAYIHTLVNTKTNCSSLLEKTATFSISCDADFNTFMRSVQLSCVFHMLRNSFWHRYFRWLHAYIQTLVNTKTNCSSLLEKMATISITYDADFNTLMRSVQLCIWLLAHTVKLASKPSKWRRFKRLDL